MPCYSFEGPVPVVDPASCLHPLASLIGDFIIGPGCFVGPGASLRGDFGRIIVEGDSSLQDNVTVHANALRDTPCCLVAGNPARIIKSFQADDITWRNDGQGEYQRLVRAARKDLAPCLPLAVPETDRPRVRSEAITVRLSGPAAIARRRRSSAAVSKE